MNMVLTWTCDVCGAKVSKEVTHRDDLGELPLGWEEVDLSSIDEKADVVGLCDVCFLRLCRTLYDLFPRHFPDPGGPL